MAPGLEAKLGYRFRDAGLRVLALTPPSSGLAPHNQRLEFLGDALLNAAVALLIHQEKAEWAEGDMSKLRGRLVSTASLAAWASDLGIALVPGPRTPKAPPGSKALADAVEALLAALHLDAGAGGFAAVVKVCEARYGEAIRQARPEDWRSSDAKTALQERAAAEGLPAPRYHAARQEGPDHAPTFTVDVELGPRRATGQGPTRKAAETEAARRLLEGFGPAGA